MVGWGGAQAWQMLTCVNARHMVSSARASYPAVTSSAVPGWESLIQLQRHSLDAVYERCGYEGPRVWRSRPNPEDLLEGGAID